MKKIFAIIMTICLMASVLCVSASALTFSSNDKIRVYGLKKDGTTYPIDGYTDFEEGWEAAVDYAEDDDFMSENKYERIVVEFLADWKANDDGEFGDSWDGFRRSTIYIPGDTKMTVNLNGHTIDRALKEWEYDGEVICIDSKADVIIENGTITGGWSGNGAGGIHIYENANVTLNNVNVEGNKTDDDNGGGIYLDSYATLTMNGGSLSKNEAHGDPSNGAGLYVDGATATLNNVTISENKGGRGIAIYVYDGFAIAAKVTLNNCVIENNNGLPNSEYQSLIYAHSPVYINGGEIKNNGQEDVLNSLFYFDEANLYMTGTKDDMVLVTGNNVTAIFYCYGNMPGKLTGVEGDYCEIVDNTGYIGGDERKGYSSKARYWFNNCKFNNNNTNNPDGYDFYAYQDSVSMFEKCDLGDTTFNTKKNVNFGKGTGLEASIFSDGEGSLSMIVSILALAASVASIGFCAILRKKITAPATANNAETEDDE